MAGRQKHKRRKGEKQRVSAARPESADKAAEQPDEELGPERRAELAQQIEAERFRGKPPSI